jgi:hypothetical protein
VADLDQVVAPLALDEGQGLLAGRLHPPLPSAPVSRNTSCPNANPAMSRMV